MKKSKFVSLVLICAALASCNKPQKSEDKSRLHMRSDESASYSTVPYMLLWYYAFRPYGYYNNGVYNRSGYYSGAIHESSNIGTNSMKGNVVRGGFGGSGGFTVSS